MQSSWMAETVRRFVDRPQENAYPWSMTTREQIRERIDKIDDAALPDLLEQIERFERRRRELSPEFFAALEAVHERNRDLSDEDALKLATAPSSYLR